MTFLTAVDERAAAAAPPGPEDSGVELGALNMLQLEALGLPVGFSKGALRVPMDTEVNSSLCVRYEHRRKNKPTAVNQLELHCLVQKDENGFKVFMAYATSFRKHLGQAEL